MTHKIHTRYKLAALIPLTALVLCSSCARHRRGSENLNKPTPYTVRNERIESKAVIEAITDDQVLFTDLADNKEKIFEKKDFGGRGKRAGSRKRFADAFFAKNNINYSQVGDTVVFAQLSGTPNLLILDERNSYMLVNLDTINARKQRQQFVYAKNTMQNDMTPAKSEEQKRQAEFDSIKNAMLNKVQANTK